MERKNILSTPIVDAINKYIEENNIPFSMPGHKAGKGFFYTDDGKKLFSNIINGDITEVEGLDNLHKPEGIIKESQELLCKLYGGAKAYYLVNGSTSGILAMIFSTFNEGDKIIVERNCHRSIFNAIILRKLVPIYLKSEIDERFNIPICINEDYILDVINENKDVKGIILTYPNYYGICQNISKIILKAKENNMKVLVDSAHGAHFGFCDSLPQNAVELGADIVVMSAHKTLPSFTQTSFLVANKNIDIENLEFYISAFMTTSPSYMFLCSMDYARNFMELYGKKEFEKCTKLARKYRKIINELSYIHVITPEDLKEKNLGIYIDESRYVINVKKQYSAPLLLKYLKKNNIQCEMCDGINIVLILSPFNNEMDFSKLYEVLKDCPIHEFEIENSLNINDIIEQKIPQSKLLPFEAQKIKDIEIVSVDNCINRVCAENITPYPPGIPILIKGELIDEHALSLIKYYLKSNISILGVDNLKIKVFTKM
jgi:arginine/lysine/ornithine decarboxylase